MKQPEHSLFAFSASPRWIPCPGSMADPANTEQGYDAGEYADEGTAAHKLAALLLKSKSGTVAEDWIGKVIRGGAREFEVTEEFAAHVQTYVDDVQRRAMGGYLMVEQRVTLAGVDDFDETNYGTSDAIIAIANYGIVCDLKFGQGEKVYAWTPARSDSLFTFFMNDEVATPVEPNYQLMMYALAALADLRLLIDEVSGIWIVINQPRLGLLSELWVPIAVLERFALFAAQAYAKGVFAMSVGVAACETSDADPKQKVKLFNPGEKQCRWCRRAACKARDQKVQEETASDFDIITGEPPAVPINTTQIAKAMAAVPFIKDWCTAVMQRANEMVAAGTQIIGPDKKPYKFVEGELGDRKWRDIKAAEAALVGVLGPDAYQPQKLLTAPGAAKKLNKKKTAQVWEDVFVPMIVRAPGKPLLALGSDPRPPFSGAATSDEFEETEE